MKKVLQRVFLTFIPNQSFCLSRLIQRMSDTARATRSGRTPVKIEYEEERALLNAPGPNNWGTVFQNIREMRKTHPAAVDTMGCERTMDPKAEPKVQRYQTLISLLLSSQTRDQVNFAAMTRLKEYGLTPQKMVDIDEDALKALLKPVSFYNNKAKFIKKVSQILLDQYNGDIPVIVEEMLKLPGIGPKMSYICMQVAWGLNEGIGVDTHVHRISERMGWTTRESRYHAPEDTRKQLQSWLPKELWQEVNILLVGFGQTICAPINPKCDLCLNKHICPMIGKPVEKPRARTNKRK